MAQWKILTQLCQNNVQVRQRVNELSRRTTFPYKFRAMYAQWIESQNWSEMDCNSESGLRKAESVFKELIMTIDSDSEELNRPPNFNLERLLDNQNALQTLKQRFEGNYSAFVSVINSCLKEEHLLIQSAFDNGESDLKRKVPKQNIPEQHALEITRELQVLQQELMLTDSKLQEAVNKQQQFRMNLAQLEESLRNLEQQILQNTGANKHEYVTIKNNMDKERTSLIHDNFQRRTEIADVMIALAVRLAQQLTYVYKECEKWQVVQRQAIAALSNPSENTLDYLEKLYDEGGKLLVNMVQQVERTITFFEEVLYKNDEKLDKLKQVHIELKKEYLETHLQSGFVIDRHPERVLKVSSGKSLGFTMSVRVLGGCGLGLEYNLPTVKVVLHHERDLKENNDSEGVCKICNSNERRFAVNRGTSACSALFNCIQLTNVRRPDRGKNEELVTEHKYAFVFTTTVQVLGCSIPLKTVSFPVVLTSQTSQEIMAKGTLIWDAAFSEQERVPFNYKESVPWGKVAEVLSNLFLVNTGRALTSEHLNYLARMAFKAKGEIDDVNNRIITEKQVIRDRIPGRDFSFWKWFWANMNLCKNYINKEWTSGLIYGFISKDEAKRKLQFSSIGTFLLRFSETNIESSQRSDISGFLTLAVVEIEPKTGSKKLFHVKEYLSPKDLQEKGLSPILDAMEVADFAKPGTKKRLLRYVWPDTSTTFEARFGSYIQEREQVEEGYHRGKYTIEIFLTDDQSRRHRQNSVDGDTLSCPATPQSSMSMPSPAAASSVYDAEASNDYSVTSGAGFASDLLEPLVFVQMPSPRQTVAVRPMQQMLSVSVMPTDSLVDEYSLTNALFNDTELEDITQVLAMDGMELGFDADNDIIVQHR